MRARAPSTYRTLLALGVIITLPLGIDGALMCGEVGSWLFGFPGCIRIAHEFIAGCMFIGTICLVYLLQDMGKDGKNV